MSGRSDDNPYVGPRPLQRGDALYGRSVELADLFHLLQARRIVVLHSPSGAGKSSLVQAGLIPRLQHARFDVWRPIRVNLDGPEGVNRYVHSTLVSLEEEVPEAHRRAPAELAGMDLSAYLRGRPRRAGRVGWSQLLLFDQFEELLTFAPYAIEEKRAFFDALGEALEVADRWALFVVREDHLPGFAPYRDRIPTQMANTFRLGLLGIGGAKEAAAGPALRAGRPLPGVDRLVEDLATVRVQRPDGSYTDERGATVEPLLLQLACRRLWESTAGGQAPAEGRSGAEVTAALRDYYAEAVRRVAGGDPTVERTVRRWVGQRLIVDGARSQVRGDGSGELDGRLLSGLLASYLVRAEPRAGVPWYELGHDRLIEPVLQDNAAWEEANLHPLQVQAQLWESRGRGLELLLSAEALPDAARWAAENASRVTGAEREFLATSREHRAAETRRRGSIAAGLVFVIAILAVAAWWTQELRVRADRANQVTQEALATEAQLATAQAEEAGARRQAAEAEAEAQRLREAQAEADRARAEAELKAFLERNPAMRGEAITLRQRERQVRWEALKLGEANDRAAIDVQLLGREVGELGRAADAAGKQLADLRAELAELGQGDGAVKRTSLAAYLEPRERVWDVLATALGTNGGLREQLLASGRLPPKQDANLFVWHDDCYQPWWVAPDPHPGAGPSSGAAEPTIRVALRTGEVAVPDRQLEDAVEAQHLARRVQFLEEERRSLDLPVEELRERVQRQESVRAAEEARQATLGGERARALDDERAVNARRTETLRQADALGPQLFDLRWSAYLVDVDRRAYTEESCVVRAHAGSIESDSAKLTRVPGHPRGAR